MGWVEFHPGRIKRLKKFQDFRKALNWSVIEGLGFLGSFWGEVIELAEDGNITGWTPEYLAELTDLKASPERVWEALARNGWIDERGGRTVVHDWLDCAGRYLEGKYRTSNPGRIVEIFSVHNRAWPKSVSSQSKDGQPYLTLPNQPNLTLPAAFEILWPQYPRREGKKEALRHFVASVQTQRDLDDLQAALKNYKAKLVKDRTEPQFVKMGSTWFNNWRDWVDYKPVPVPLAVQALPKYKETLPDDSELPTPDEITAAKKEAGLTK